MRQLEIVHFDKTGNDEILNTLTALRKQWSEEQYPRYPPAPHGFYRRRLLLPETINRRVDYYLLQLGKEFVGYIQVISFKVTDINQWYVYPYVIPEFRKQGIAKRALISLIDRIPTEVELIATDFVHDATEDPSSLHNFLTKIGAKLVYTENINVSEFSSFDKDEVHLTALKLQQEAEQKGYRIIFIDDGQFKSRSDINYQQFLDMVHSIWNDMPTEDASWEEEPISEEIHDEFFDRTREMNGISWTYLAIHEASGDACGLTDILFYNDYPEMIYQGDTGVLAAHRGHRLGKTLKYLMLDKILHDDQLQHSTLWKTGNANSNEHMLNINYELQYHLWYQERNYEMPLEKYLEWLTE